MDDKIRSELIDLCMNIYAHNELDWEINLAGNGTNSSEASNVADEIMDILGVKVKSKKFKALLAEKIKELKGLYKPDEEEEDDEEDEYDEEGELKFLATSNNHSEVDNELDDESDLDASSSS